MKNAGQTVTPSDMVRHMSFPDETYGVLDTHKLVDKELAVLITACGMEIPDGTKKLKESKGFIVINFLGRGIPQVLRGCEAGLQAFSDGSYKITHVKPPSTFKDPEALLDVIDSIKISVDIESWIQYLVLYEYGKDSNEIIAWFQKIFTITETQYNGDVVRGRKFRDEDAETFPLENLL